MRNSIAFLFVTLFIFSCTCEEEQFKSIPCINEQLPIVFLHGALGSGDNFSAQALRFSSNGYCPEKLYAFDWNSLGGDPAEEDLDVFISNILNSTGSDQVNLIGHSAGGGLAYDYCADPDRAAKINKYAHLGSFVNDQAAGSNGEVSTINIWSPDDLIVPGGDINGATNVSIPDKDHFQIATSSETFDAMYQFFEDGTPEFLESQEQDRIQIEGRLVHFGTNEPQTDVFINIYEIDGITGKRISSDPNFELVSDTGNWGPIEINKSAYYEFEISRVESAFRVIHYYFEPFVRSNRFVYLRSFPPATTPAGILLASLPRDDNQSVHAIFCSNQAVIDTRDELLFGDFELSNSTFASADQTSITFFMYDDGDYETSGEPHFLFTGIPFLNGADIFNSAEGDETITATFNGTSLSSPNWKSDEEGVSVFVFN